MLNTLVEPTSLVRLQKGSAMGMWLTPGGLLGWPSYSVSALFVVLFRDKEWWKVRIRAKYRFCCCSRCQFNSFKTTENVTNTKKENNQMNWLNGNKSTILNRNCTIKPNGGPFTALWHNNPVLLRFHLHSCSPVCRCAESVVLSTTRTRSKRCRRKTMVRLIAVRPELQEFPKSLPAFGLWMKASSTFGPRTKQTAWKHNPYFRIWAFCIYIHICPLK